MAASATMARLAAPLAIAFAGAIAAGCGGADSNERDADAPAEDARAATADASGSGATCGGFSDARCGDGLYCDFDDNLCGGRDGEGTCRESPAGCSRVYRPACGCDGEVYSNPCRARASGVDLSDGGGCERPEGMFACGHRFCDRETQYCRVAVSDVAGTPDSYECDQLPDACGADPSCDCLDEAPCGGASCEDSDGELTVTCPGG